MKDFLKKLFLETICRTKNHEKLPSMQKVKSSYLNSDSVFCPGCVFDTKFGFQSFGFNGTLSHEIGMFLYVSIICPLFFQHGPSILLGPIGTFVPSYKISWQNTADLSFFKALYIDPDQLASDKVFVIRIHSLFHFENAYLQVE